MGLISNGTTIFDNGAVEVGGSMVLVSSATASSSASIEFTLGDYKEYKFFFVSMHPQTDNVNFQFQCSTDGGSTYGTTITSTYFAAQHNEANTVAQLIYITAFDLAQSTAYQTVSQSVGSGNDESASGMLQLFNPSSTTYVKHFICTTNLYHRQNWSYNPRVAGYFNDTNDLTNIKFQFASGNIDAGTIYMFGVN